ncbi:MAG: glycosyltransferase family 1 protein [Candidatus Beckwithbacteria bacterium]|nr:glycosyltransferase family 1 protein [Candidatus Beckwithbacteria bacterium]
MIIGIDASRALIKDKTGTENYSAELIEALLQLPEAGRHQFRLYTRENIRWPRLWTQGGLAWELLQRPPDVLFIPAHTLPLIRRPNLKTVVTIHGLEYEYLPQYYRFPQKLYLNQSTEYAVKHADRLIAVSAWTKAQLVERLGADKHKITVIHEGVGSRIVKAKTQQFKSDYQRQIRYKYNLPKNFLLFVGTIQPRKNLVRLIEAFARLISEKLNLVIAGKLGWMYDEILAAPKKYGVVSRVKFIGRVADADLAAVYKLARVFVWPSLMEGFGLPVLEAMTLGVPVITSDRGAIPEVAGKAALLVKPEDTAGLSRAMELMLTSEELCQGLIEAGFRQAAKFSWERAARQTLQILTEKW